VNYDKLLVVAITVTCYLWAPSTGDHFIYMWRHLQDSTVVSAVSSIGIRDNNIVYITPTIILYEDMKTIEHVLLHPICVLRSLLSHLMCASKYCHIKLSLCY